MSLKKETYESLRYRIITNDFQSGQQLYEKELMQEYGIGRTPLREIFQELQRNGLIEIIPKLGTSNRISLSGSGSFWTKPPKSKATARMP